MRERERDGKCQASKNNDYLAFRQVVAGVREGVMEDGCLGSKIILHEGNISNIRRQMRNVSDKIGSSLERPHLY